MSYNLETLEPIDDRAEWMKEWVGMPEFNPAPKKEFASIIVRFETEENFKDFQKLIDKQINLNHKGTKSIWYPELPESTLERFF